MSGFVEGFVAYRFDPNTLTRTGLNHGLENEFVQWAGQYGNVESRPAGRRLIWLEGEAEELAPFLAAIHALLEARASD